MRKLKLFTLLTVLCCSMMLWAADEGPWTRITWNVGQTGLTATTSSSFNNLNGNHGPTISWWNDDDGIGYTINSGSFSGNTKIGVFSIYERQESVPSYTRKVLTWTYQIGSCSYRHHSNTALYGLYGPSNDLKNITVDFTYNYSNGAGSGYLAERFYNNTCDNKGHFTNSKTWNMEFDNRNGTSQVTKTWSLLLTHVVGCGSTVSDSHEWAGFKSISESWTTYYYKYVSFNGNGSTSGSMSTQTIENSGNLKANAFSRTGYTFDGWATSPTGSKAYNSQATITATSSSKGPVTLYAHWVGNKYTVTLNQQSGSGGSSSVQATYGSAMPSMTIPTRTGYTFGGYYTGTGGSGTQYYNANGESVRSWDQTSNTTLYAKWTLNTYTVSYNGNGSTSGSTSSQTKTYGVTLQLRNNGYSRTGYTFSKWNTQANGTGTNYNAGANYTTNAAATMYAQWTANTYKVKFNGNGSTSGSMSDQNFTYDAAQNLTANGFSKTGYTFAGWATSADGDKAYDNQQSVNNLTATNGGTVNLYAVWTVNQYTITFNNYDDTQLQSSQVNYGATPAYTGTTPTKPSTAAYTYTFNGWSPAIATVTGDATYTAQFTEQINQATVDAAIALINAIGSPITAASQTAINAARNAYDNLTDDQKALVGNLSTLTNAEAALAVVNLINAIDDQVVYTDACHQEILAARAAYDNLTDDQKALVDATTLQVLTDAEAAYAALEADHNAANAAIALINAIDNPVVYTDACHQEILAAREAYDNLTAEQKALVDATTLQKLTDAEAAYAALEADHAAADAVIAQINAIGSPITAASQTAIDAARNAYDNLTDDQKALVGNLSTLTNAEAALAVIDLINAIDDQVVYTDACHQEILAAREAYDNLTDDQKALVGNYATLTDAEAAYAALEADHNAANAAIALINAIDNPVVYTTACHDKITGAREAYDNLTAEQKALVDATTLQVLTDAEAAYAALEADHTLVAVPTSSSSYEPTQIANGGFETQPTMAGYGSNRIPNGTNQGWNTTENGNQCFEWISNVPQYHNPNLTPIGNYCVEMNADNSATLYQDLYTNGGDVIRWSLAHAVRTKYCGPDEQYIRVDVGAPLYNGNNIVYPTGVNYNINTNINPDTKATYRYNGITNPTGNTYGFNGQNLENLKLSKSAQALQWYHASGVYIVPESQSVTRFAFVSEDNSSCGNLLDDIHFSTLIGDLDATYGDNNSVVIKGYWGETDTSKKLIIDCNGTIYKVDMTSVSGQNFVITMTYDNMPTSIMVYHEDYVSAARILSVHYSISVSAEDVELVYDGNAHTISPVVTDPESGYTLKYGTSLGDISLDELSYTAVGTYTIYYSVSAQDYTTYKGQATLRITKTAFPTNIQVTPPTPLTLDYARHNQTLAEAGSCTGYEMAYALGENGENAPTTGWSTTIPQGKQSGSYYVWYKVLGGENYEDSNPAYVVATINEPVWHTVSFTVNNSAMGSLEVRSVVYSEDLNTLGNGTFALPDEWTNDATYPWVVENHALKSGNGGQGNKTSTIQATYNFTKPGKISFSYSISSETCCDKGYFSIDNVTKINGIRGDSYGTFTANVDAGEHTFKWWYSKDGNVNSGADAFFIDNIVIYEFPTDITNTTCLTGDKFELVATPEEEGSYFARWEDNSTDENRVVTINQDTTITAYFNAYAHVTVNSNAPSKGTATINTQAGVKEVGDGTFYVVPGSEVSFTATPNTGESFYVWLDEDNKTLSTESTFNMTINEDMTLTAYFDPVLGIGDPNNATEIETFLTNNDGQTIDELIIDRPVLNNMYNTLCLPFDMDATQIAASSLNGVEIREFTGASVSVVDQTLELEVSTPVNAVVAGRPYFVKYSAASQLDNLHFEGVTINNAVLDNMAVTFDGVTFKGTFTPFVMPNGLSFQGGYLFLGQNNQLFWPNTNNPLKPFRAYFYVDVESSTPSNAPKYRGMPARIVEGTNVATGVENAQSANQSTKVIVNGQLIIIKNDVRYNAQGQKVK